jgi:hypothetical protein
MASFRFGIQRSNSQTSEDWFRIDYDLCSFHHSSFQTTAPPPAIDCSSLSAQDTARLRTSTRACVANDGGSGSGGRGRGRCSTRRRRPPPAGAEHSVARRVWVCWQQVCHLPAAAAGIRCRPGDVCPGASRWVRSMPCNKAAVRLLKLELTRPLAAHYLSHQPSIFPSVLQPHGVPDHQGQVVSRGAPQRPAAGAGGQRARALHPPADR